MPTLNYIFNLSIIIGFVIPLLNIITGWFGGFFDAGGLDIDTPSDINTGFDADIGVGVNTDIASTDIGSAGLGVADAGSADLGGTSDGAGGTGATDAGSGAFIRFNVMCLCLFLVVFGAVGHAVKGFMTSAALIVILLAGCVFIAGVFYWALYRFVIEKLSRNNPVALHYQGLCGKRAIVTLPIKADTMGTISLSDSIGAPITFRAKMDPDIMKSIPDAIPKGETVIITEVDTENKLCFVTIPIEKMGDKLQ